MTPVTANDMAELLRARMESDAPDAVLDVFKREAGKPLTKRILAKLPGGAEVWRLSYHAGMTALETWDYTRSQGNNGVHLLVAYAEKNVTIDAAFLEERNPAYYVARRERNAARVAALADACKLTILARRINAVREARAKLAAAEAELEEMAGYGKAFGSDQYEIEKIAGMRGAS